MHISSGQDMFAHGTRYPAIWLNKGRFFLISTSANGIYNYGEGYNGDPLLNFKDVKLDHDYHIVISQQMNEKKKLMYTITVDGETFHAVENTDPKTISPALVYLSDPWYPSIGDIGEVFDFHVLGGTGE